MINQREARRVSIILFTLALAACNSEERWKVEYVRIETPSNEEVPKSGDELKRSDSLQSVELSIQRVEDPSAIVPSSQTMAIVRSLGTRSGDHDDCTGFFVSSRDFLTARHCVDPERSAIDVDLGEVRGTERAKCSLFPEPEEWKDWAICSLEDELEFVSTLPLTKCAPKTKTLAVIMGFCKADNSSGLGAGAETAPGLPNAGVVQLLTPERGFLPARAAEGHETSGCPLDSGGPAFIAEDLEERGDLFRSSGTVRVFGIISRIGDCPEGEAERTCIAPTADGSFLDFLEKKRTGTVTILDCDE